MLVRVLALFHGRRARRVPHNSQFLLVYRDTLIDVKGRWSAPRLDEDGIVLLGKGLALVGGHLARIRQVGLVAHNVQRALRPSRVTRRAARAALGSASNGALPCMQESVTVPT